MKLAELEATYLKEQQDAANAEAKAQVELEAEHARILREIVRPIVLDFFTCCTKDTEPDGLDREELDQVIIVTDDDSFSWQETPDGLMFPCRVGVHFQVPEHYEFHRDLIFDGKTCSSDRQYYCNGWFNSMREVLAASARQYQNDEKQREYLSQEAAHDRERELAQELAQQVVDDTAEAERKALFSWVERDPIALALLKMFVAVDRERGNWQERIESAEMAAGNMEYSLSKTVSRLQREVVQARQETDDARGRANDAEYERDEAAKKAKRGW